jgi:hypothetical protein
MVRDPSHQCHKIVKNSCFRTILSVFVSYSTLFWGTEWIYMARDPSHEFHKIEEKRDFKAFFVVFVGYNTQFWGPGLI